MPAQVTVSDVAETAGSGVRRRLLIDGSLVAGLEGFLERKTFAVPVMGGNQ